MLLSSIVAVVGITNETRSKQQTGDSQLAPVTPCACVAKCISDIPVPVLQWKPYTLNTDVLNYALYETLDIPIKTVLTIYFIYDTATNASLDT